MNTVVTSREQILGAAKEIAALEGVAQISIRGVAKACGVSVGSIYNYFPTKSELVIAVIEDFWQGAFAGMPMDELKGLPLPDCFHRVYASLQSYMETFQKNWLKELSQLEKTEKQMGRSREQDYFSRIRSLFLTCLDNDPSIPQTIWSENFAKENFVEFCFENLMALLRTGKGDAFFRKVLCRCLGK